MDIVVDTTAMFGLASDLVNAFWPIIGIITGVSLGFGIIKFIANAIKSAF